MLNSRTLRRILCLIVVAILVLLERQLTVNGLMFSTLSGCLNQHSKRCDTTLEICNQTSWGHMLISRIPIILTFKAQSLSSSSYQQLLVPQASLHKPPELHVQESASISSRPSSYVSNDMHGHLGRFLPMLK